MVSVAKEINSSKGGKKNRVSIQPKLNKFLTNNANPQITPPKFHLTMDGLDLKLTRITHKTSNPINLTTMDILPTFKSKCCIYN